MNNIVANPPESTRMGSINDTEEDQTTSEIDNQESETNSMSAKRAASPQDSTDEQPMCETGKILMNVVQNVVDLDRKSDLLQIIPRRHKSSRVIMLFDDMKTTLIKDCLSIDTLVREMLNNSSIKRKHPEDQNNECAICTESLESSQYIRRLSCNHEFHCTCIRKSFLLGNNAKCPLCRHDFLSDYMHENLSDEIPDPEEFEGKTVIANAILV